MILLCKICLRVVANVQRIYVTCCKFDASVCVCALRISSIRCIITIDTHTRTWSVSVCVCVCVFKPETLLGASHVTQLTLLFKAIKFEIIVSNNALCVMYVYIHCTTYISKSERVSSLSVQHLHTFYFR